jgi:hypothetical protein
MMQMWTNRWLMFCSQIATSSSEPIVQE